MTGGVVDLTEIDDRVVYDHNGSEVLIDTKKGLIVYAVPKPSLVRTGVVPGQVLFRGRLSDPGLRDTTLFVGVFDAVAFAFYDNWAAPVCITALQFAGLFVLANRLGVSGVIALFFEVIRSWGHREKDPG